MSRFVMKMPDIGEGVVDAEIVAWYVEPGSVVAEDQHIADVLTDKATVEMSSPVSGTVLELAGSPGDRVVIGTPLIVFETAAATQTAVSTAPVQAPAPSPAAAVVREACAREPAGITADLHSVSEQPSASSTARKVLAAPSVRRRAREALLDIGAVAATGSGGRITHEDLERHIAATRTRPSPAAAPPAPAAEAPRPAARHAVDQSDSAEGTVRAVPLIGMRRVIAEKMALSKRRIPHYSYIEEVDVSELQALQGHMNQRRRESQPKLSLLPFIMKALIRALVDFPYCNALFDDEAGVLTEYAAVHIGIAVATPNGLMVPVVRDAQSLDVWQLAAEVQRLGEAARTGRCAREELGGSTITITSLGKLGGIASTPVINHPEVAILGVNRAVERPVIRNGTVVARTMMNLSASFDHRIVDGYDGARLVQALKEMLEFPATIFT